MDYVLFGIQGAGKGTQGKILADKLQAGYFETGAELRRLAKEDSPLGQKVRTIIESGHLVPTSVVMEIVENYLTETLSAHGGEATIIFDGIPRNAEQDAALRSILAHHERDFVGLHFVLSREEAENRLINRRVCSVCKIVYPHSYPAPRCECGGELVTRTDDNAEAIKIRLDIFESETLPVIKAWENQGSVINIDASKTIEEVTKEVLEATGA
ncbi:hypothetical protein CO046_04870 [Candidatus Peregrinibacteria bacterium CG_4_9_14_0_2_um_filter_53_11]|nr:MAG: hypothetical protein CO046_04870 [Candidatus Peregrinibacteria bacterium CG_4_9_14_0_2_um_filter_53_11]